MSAKAISLAAMGVVLLQAGITSAAAISDTSALRTVVNKATALGGATLGSFTYDATNDRIYVVTFGSGAGVRVIDNVFDGTPTLVSNPYDTSKPTYVSDGNWLLFNRNGDPTLTGGATPSGILLNPKAIGSNAAGSLAVIIDSGTVPKQGTTALPALGQILYTYNLQAVVPNPDATEIPTSAPYYDGRDVFTSVLTKSELNTAAGYGASTNNTSNLGRQFAWSGDGQSVYFVDSGAAFGGVWNVNISTGDVKRVVTETSSSGRRIWTEPAVLQLNGTTDRVIFEGSTTYGNVGGINYSDYTYGATSGSTPQALISKAELDSFTNNDPANNFTTWASVVNQNTGDYFFYTQNGVANNADDGSSPDSQRRAILRRDSDGNLWKVASFLERKDYSTSIGVSSINTSVYRLQIRETTLNGKPITELLYAEPSSGNYIAGVYVYTPGDFTQDNSLALDDVDLFRTSIINPAAATSKYDLNGDNVVTFSDVKLGLKAYDFGAADANLDGVVDFSDFQILQNNYGSASNFINGDFNGTGTVDFSDFQILQNSYGYTSSIFGSGVVADLTALPTWVPEPASLSLLGIAGLALARRRRA